MRYSGLLPYTILLISVSSVLAWCSLPIGNTFLWWLLQSIILLIFNKQRPSGYRLIPVRCFLLLLMINALYGGLFMTENYWDWKMLVSNLMIFLLPLASYAYATPDVLVKTLKIWLKFAWIMLIFLFPSLSSDAFGRYLVPFSFLSLFFALLNKKYILIVIIAYGITIILGTDSRSDMLKFSVTLALGLSYLLIGYKKIFVRILRFLTVVFYILPFIFFILGSTGVFNIFKIDEELKLDGEYTMISGGEEKNALVDTRTFLYAEEIASAINNNYVIHGRSIARGYDSFWFGDAIDKELGIKRGERGGCETSILNVFNYFGLIGVVIYLWIFLSASYLALIRSNNIFVPIVGTYVAFRWMFAWVEDFSKFDLNYLFLWIMIGICFSPWFRGMTNAEFKNWVNLIIR